jgi:glycosyltransferase involved in cell wall biosynthesis
VRSPLGALRSRVRQARFRATPVHAWPILIGGKFAQTRLGWRLMSRSQTATAPRQTIEAASAPRRGKAGRNVLFVSHCDFTGQSAYHVFSIATELERLGWSPAIAVPRSSRGVRELGRPRFHVLSFRDARQRGVEFPDGHGPDLVHSFTPRQPVRSLTLDLVGRYGCPYVVHLEDNEMAVQGAVVSAYDDTAVGAFLEAAAGVSVVIDRLLELKPDGIPGVVIWPGYDQAIDAPLRPRGEIRKDIGLGDGEVALLYPGNVHEVNVDEVSSLYAAVGSLRASGRNVILVKSGWNRVAPTRLPKLGKGIRDLGWISRRRVLELLHAADVLVQPGSPGPFNDYRFPSKLPEFLASGRPVVLPRTNIGLHLEDNVEAMLLERGERSEIAEHIAALADDPELRKRMGQRGRSFALRELQWSKNVQQLIDLYGRLS